MKITVSRIPADPQIRNDQAEYNIAADDAKIALMSVQYPATPSIYCDSPSIARSIAYTGFNSKQIVALLALDPSILDSKAVAAMSHSLAMWTVEAELYPTGSVVALFNKAHEFGKNADLMREVYGHIKTELESIQRGLTGEIEYEGLVAKAWDLVAYARDRDNEVKEAIGKQNYDYLKLEKGLDPLTMATKIGRVAETLTIADQIFQGREQQLLKSDAGIENYWQKSVRAGALSGQDSSQALG